MDRNHGLTKTDTLSHPSRLFLCKNTPRAAAHLSLCCAVRARRGKAAARMRHRRITARLALPQTIWHTTAMPGYRFTLIGAALIALASGALHWPDRQMLVVSDLHFGKAERLARRGGTLLPPFDTRETLSRLDADITATNPTAVICLGDSFDDLDAAQMHWPS